MRPVQPSEGLQHPGPGGGLLPVPPLLRGAPADARRGGGRLLSAQVPHVLCWPQVHSVNKSLLNGVLGRILLARIALCKL